MFSPFRMLCLPVVLALLCCALGRGMAQAGPQTGPQTGSQCAPHSLKIVIRSHRNRTRNWQTSSITQDEESNNLWKMCEKHRTIADGEDHSTLETTLYLKAQPANNQQEVVHNCNGKQQVTTPSPLSSTESPPERYHFYPGVGYYKFHHEVTTWPAARDQCAREGGHLVIINSPAEREVVRKLFVELNPTSEGSSNPNQIHAGLKRVGDGKYTTLFGLPMGETGFSEWAPGQPSNGAREPCVSIMIDTMAYNDISCNIQILAYICEIELDEERTNLVRDVIHIGTDKQPTENIETLEMDVFPFGYALYPGVGYYKFHHGVTSWPNARDQCAREGGHLVIINSPAEREVVRKLFVELNPTSEGSSNSNQIHAGLKRVGDGKYTTIFGVPMEETGFSEWAPRQPSSPAREHCVSIMNDTMAYNDISCRIQILAYICEVALELIY